MRDVHAEQSFPAGLILADGEFSELEGVIIGAPLQLTNNYLQAVAYYEVRGKLSMACHVLVHYSPRVITVVFTHYGWVDVEIESVLPTWHFVDGRSQCLGGDHLRNTSGVLVVSHIRSS